MANESQGKRSAARGDSRLVALTHELGAQLRRMRGAGPKIMQLLSMIELERPSGEASAHALGTLPEARGPVPLRRLRRVIEQDLDVGRTFEFGYPPRSPWLSMLRRLTFPPPTLLLRRMEIQTLSLLGELRAGGAWAAIAAEHWAAQPPLTPLDQEDAAFFKRRNN